MRKISKKRSINKTKKRSRKYSSQKNSKQRSRKRFSKKNLDGVSRKFLSLVSIIGNLWLTAGKSVGVKISGPTNIDIAINRDTEKIIILASDEHGSREGVCDLPEYSIENFINDLNKVTNKNIDYFIEGAGADVKKDPYLNWYKSIVTDEKIPDNILTEDSLEDEQLRLQKLEYFKLYNQLKNQSPILKSVEITNVHYPDIRKKKFEKLMYFLLNNLGEPPFDIIKDFNKYEYNFILSMANKKKFIKYCMNNKNPIYAKINTLTNSEIWKKMYKEYIVYSYNEMVKELSYIFEEFDANEVLKYINKLIENNDKSIYNYNRILGFILMSLQTIELDMNSLIINEELKNNVSMFYFGSTHINNIKYFLTKIYPKYHDNSWNVIESSLKYDKRCISTEHIFNSIESV